MAPNAGIQKSVEFQDKDSGDPADIVQKYGKP